jgi:hypothetical protein
VENIEDIEYLQNVKHGDHKALVAKAIVRYKDLPGQGFYKLVCVRCGSTIPDPWAGEKFDEAHVAQYVLAWKKAVNPDCKEALRLNQIRQVMDE